MDLIDRQAAIDASESEKQTLKELMIKYGFSAPNMTVTEFVEDILPSAQLKPCEDAVSRAEIVRWTHFWFEAVDIKPDRFIAGIKRLPSVTPKQRWIPCSERLPKERHDVLITKEPFKIKGYEQEVIKAKRSADLRSGKIEWWSPEFGTLTNKAVLAWMPLPKPYKAESEEV